MDTLLLILCGATVGHRLTRWVPCPELSSDVLAFKQARCRVCRQWQVRPWPLTEPLLVE